MLHLLVFLNKQIEYFPSYYLCADDIDPKMQRHLSVKRGIKLKEINDASIDSGRAFFLKSWYNASFLLLTGAAEPAIAFTVMLLVTDGGAGKGV